MSADLRLVIFDVDGTLVDSQGDIIVAMQAAFDHADHPMPDRATVLSVVGLSLDVMFARLMPELSTSTHNEMIETFKATYMAQRDKGSEAQSSPLYAGALETLQRLHAVPDLLLGVATGKSKRGLGKVIEGHGLEGLFVTPQVADFHPSKPHPSMLMQAMADVGVGPNQTVMIGDTSFDMEMAALAGARGVGVSWGYHTRERLNRAAVVIDDFAGVHPALEQIWGVVT
ncbi:MAG: HAD-IA family hydrolase [Sulfitobacter sp.]